MCSTGHLSAQSRQRDEPGGLRLTEGWFAKGSGTSRAACSLREDDCNDHAVKAERLTEDKDQNHADEDGFLLSVCADTSVTNNANSETSCLKLLNMRDLNHGLINLQEKRDRK